MKIIHIRDARIIMNSQTEYKIQTPIGVLNDINDAVKLYPYLIEDKRVKQCPICNKHFIDQTRFNKRIYCSDECSRKANSNKSMENYYNRIFTGQKIFRPEHYLQQLKDYTNRDFQRDPSKLFIQDDNYWGLGCSNLSGTPANNPEKEHQYIQDELKRFGLETHRKSKQ